MRLFARKPPIDRDEFEWLLACFAWLRTVLDDADVRAALDAVDLMQWRYD